MSRKTVSRGTAAVALATFLTLAGAAPTLAAPRHTGEPGLRAPTSVWGLMVNFSEHLVRWAFGAGWSEKAVGSAPDTTDFVPASDPNGQQISVDPASPVGTAPSPGGGRG
jgi:hypothetical protein